MQLLFTNCNLCKKNQDISSMHQSVTVNENNQSAKIINTELFQIRVLYGQQYNENIASFILSTAM